MLRYALVPGAGIVDAVREGHRLNLPAARLTGARPVRPLVTVEDDRVVVAAVKLAEDRSGDVVVRLHECLGGRAEATLAPDFPVASVHAVDLLERPREEDAGAFTALPDGTVALRLRPFQILTLRLSRHRG
ncbi:glycosyl hydrolase-related protein [Streptomyces durbertensis]|uniref:glycosyl hydrolase-related protein n=1 Tax=Streptomyces durbertensis TaxID=2448886 RepID=UPI002B2024C9|nr:glycosyl hydrolase-related protein [Streptomyces durbertensis]